MTGPGSSAAPLPTGSGAWSYTTAALVNGAHSLTATATDAVGTSAASTALTVTIDTIAPATPVLTTKVATGSFAYLVGTSEPNSTVSIFDGVSGTLVGTALAAANGSWSFTKFGVAATTFNLTATDAAGNSSGTPNVQLQPPGAPAITSFSTDSGTVGDGLTNDNTLTLTGTATAGSTVKVYDGATLLGSATANSNGAWSYTTTALSNGAHGLTATATDATGVTGPASMALNVTIDATAPVAPTISSFSTDSGVTGDGITNDNTLTLTGTAEAGSTVNVYDGATFLGSANANGSGAWSFTTAALTNGTHSLTATATDAAGNTGVASTALSVTIDTSAPVAPTIASFSTDSGVSGDGITNDNTLTLTGTAEANTTVNVYDGTTLLGSATANGSGAWSYTTAALSNGGHNLTATATDAAGNTGVASSALSVIIDTSAPVAPTIASFSTDSGVSGDGITNDSTLALTGTAEVNGTVKVYDGATLLGSATANGGGAWSYTTAALTNGGHNLTATATDAAGNTGVASTALNVTIDTVAPVAPTISLFSTDSGVVGDGITNDKTLTLTGTAEANSTVKVYDGATLLGTATANGSGAWSCTTAALVDGGHSLTATATDAAGNSGAASATLNVTIDTTAPVVPSIGSGVIVNTNEVALTGTAEAGSTVKVYDGASLLGNATANASGTWSYTSPALSGGGHNFTATATDAAGNTGIASTAVAVTINTIVPVAPVISSFTPDTGVVGDGITSVKTLTLTGTAEAGTTVKVYDGATLLGSTLASGSGAWSYTTAPLGNGTHSLTATDTDALGNTSTASSTLSVTIAAAPAVPTISSFSTDSGVVGDHITNDNTLTLNGTADANSTVKVYDGATLLGSATANSSGTWSYTTAALADGGHSLSATDTDAAGNTSAASTATGRRRLVAPATPTSSYTIGTGTFAYLVGTAESPARFRFGMAATVRLLAPPLRRPMVRGAS